MKRLSLAMMGLAIAGLMTMVSCRKPVNQFNTTGEKITFSATTENNSKTYAEEVGDDMYVKWSEEDKIRINGNEDVNLFEIGNISTSGTEADFTGWDVEAAEDGYLASYPIDATNNGTTVTFNVPAAQDNGTNLNGKIPMAAYIDKKGGNLVFHNMVNILQLNLTGTKSLTKIEVESTENLNGTFTVGASLTPTAISGSESTQKKITIDYTENPLNLNTNPTMVYVVLPVFGDKESMVTVKFTGDEGEMTGSFKLIGSEPGSYATTPNHRYKVGVEVTLVEPVETDEWINFGLPEPYQNLKWAKKSIGATCSTENTKDPNTAATWYGDYYAWGATTTWYDGTVPSHTWKSDYSDGYVDTNAPYYDFNSECGYNKYTYEGPTTLELSDPCDDAARAVLGGSWRMPTSSEWKQLKDNTLFVRTNNYKDISNLNGYVVYKVKETAHKGKVATSSGEGDCNYSGTAYALTDPHMFLPIAGRFDGTGLMNTYTAYYWSKSISSDPYYASYLFFTMTSDIEWNADGNRYYGCSVRPVQ